MNRNPAEAGKLLDDLVSRTAEERLAIVRTWDDPGGFLHRLLGHAEALVATDLAAAESAARLLADIADAINLPEPAVSARRCLAQTAAYANRFEEALRILREAVNLADHHGLPLAGARARITMLHALDRLGRFDEAIAEGRAARKIFEDAGEPMLLARADVNLGVTYRMRDEPEQALACFDRARAHLNDPLMLAQLESNRAEALLDLNRFEDAEAAFRTALAQLHQLDRPRAAAIVEGNLADLLSRQGRITEAMTRFEQAERFFENEQAPGDLARLQAEHAEALATIGAWDEAAEYYRRAIPALADRGLAFEAARARAGFGLVLANRGEDEQADQALAEAVTGFERLGHKTGAARVRIVQAELYMRRGQNDRSRSLLVEAMEWLEDRPADAATARARLAAIALDTDNLTAAASLLDQAFEATSPLNFAPRVAELHLLRARLQIAQMKPLEAINELRNGIEQVERLRGTLQTRRLRTAFQLSHLQLYDTLILALLDQDDEQSAREAFDTAEAARARSLLEQVVRPDELSRVSDAVEEDSPLRNDLEDLARLRAELNALYSRIDDLAPGDPASTLSATWREQVDERERRIARLEHRLAVGRGPGQLFAQPASSAQVQRALDGATALAEFYFAGDQLMCFLITPNRFEVVRLHSTLDEVREQVEHLRFQISRSIHWIAAGVGNDLRDDCCDELAQLGQMLIEPIADRLNEISHVIVVPHGPLHDVPFHALRLGGQYLLERHGVSLMPSASMLLSVIEQGPIAETRGDHLVVGVPDDAAPLIAEETEAVARSLPDAIVLEAEEATIASVRRAMSRARLIHLACHGRYFDQHPMASGLRLADGWLTVGDLYGLDLNGAVVTLSACDTGQSRVETGEEMIGILRGFFAARASAVLISQWMVHDEMTAKMLASAYDRWHNVYGGSPRAIGTAVRETQLELLREHDHPVLWASFTLAGLS